MSAPAIVLRAVCKRFGRTLALDDVSFCVGANEVVGFVGPNGSGKTTTLRIVSGFLDADAGQVEVAGHDVVEERTRVRECVGYMPESVPLYRDMRVGEYLRFRARLKRVPGGRVAERVARVCEDCGLDGHEKRIIGHLSKGYRQRVGLADALLAEPPILLLDEPTSGLDPVQVRDVRGLIGELAERHTIVISTHVLAEVEAMASRVVMMVDGRVVGDGAIDALRAGCGLDARSSLEDVFLALVGSAAEAGHEEEEGDAAEAGA